MLFALLAAGWDTAADKIEDLLRTLNHTGFAFSRDFILKTCLTLLDRGARYDVSQFRKPGTLEDIEKQWDNISAAIEAVLDFVKTTSIRTDKALPSYLALIPLVLPRYHVPEKWEAAKRDAEQYLLQTLLAGVFRFTPDQLIDDIVGQVRREKRFNVEEVFEVMRARQFSLQVTWDKVSEMGYGSGTVHLLFNLWYRSL